MKKLSLKSKRSKSLVAVTALVSSLFLVAACDDDSAIVDAAQELSDGAEDAAEKLDPNRTLGEKVGDTIEDAGEKIQDVAD